ncbi:electron transfer flavoprotein subunit alpha/FixB family protein [Pelotomaculum propionicicum]|uniref:electron transfer flavoprotein subunit alpha/FixB family protein n=1 Tax=Pelotomaculum propionicicum TaxID=258475 RepID=UPI003B7BDF3C
MDRKILLVLEHNGKDITASSLRLCANLGKLTGRAGGEVAAVLFSLCAETSLEQLSGCGIGKVFLVPGPEERYYSAGQRAAVLLELAAAWRPTLIMLPGGLQGRETAPLLASELDAGLLSECVQVKLDGERTEAVVNVYNGQYQMVCEMTGSPNVLVMADVNCGPAKPGLPAEIEAVELAVGGGVEPALTLLETFAVPAAEMNIGEADIVVGAGRGVKSRHGLSLVAELAGAAGAPLGGTRPAVDAGWIPPDRQIGQTGRSINPVLYLAVGVSGAQQHISGVAGGKIAAINNDPGAPVFRVADLGAVGDFEKIVPLLTEKLRSLGRDKREPTDI